MKNVNDKALNTARIKEAMKHEKGYWLDYDARSNDGVFKQVEYDTKGGNFTLCKLICTEPLDPKYEQEVTHLIDLIQPIKPDIVISYCPCCNMLSCRRLIPIKDLDEKVQQDYYDNDRKLDYLFNDMAMSLGYVLTFYQEEKDDDD